MQKTATVRLVAEWEHQYAVLLTWPRQHGDWSAHFAAVEAVYYQIVGAIGTTQAIILLCESEEKITEIRAKLADNKQILSPIHYYVVATDDTWIRDYGPLSVYRQHGIKLINFAFNAWGNKYAYQQDNQAFSALTQLHSFPQPWSSSPLILEGGAVESNGAGTLLATQRSVVSESRNPGLTLKDMETLLEQQLGLKHFHWLQHGYLAGDDTGGHIDMLARFINAESICYSYCSDENDEHFADSQAFAKELAGLRSPTHKAYTLIPLPWPSARYSATGQRLPASYANFLILNKIVLLPTYQNDKDQQAIAILSQCFPERTVVAIDCLALIEQRGSLHCATLQLHC